MLISAGADVNLRGDNGQTPLSYAADYTNKEMASLLISAGADVNLRGDKEGHHFHMLLYTTTQPLTGSS